MNKTPPYLTKEMNPALKDIVSKAFIITCGEDVSKLAKALSEEGMNLEVLNRKNSPEESDYPRAIKCLLSHSEAWKLVAQSDQTALVVESDFVPCRGLGSFKLPYNPNQESGRVAYLYTGCPVIYHKDRFGNFFGHSSTTVAYTVDAAAARLWLELLSEYEQEKDFRDYYQWDVEMPVDLRWKKGVRLYLAEKCYGEHGGIPNPEHSKHGYTCWHQADSLMAPLAFMPNYAKGSHLRFVFFRARSRARYIYRFVLGKYFDTWSRFMQLKPNRRDKFLFAFKRAFF